MKNFSLCTYFQFADVIVQTYEGGTHMSQLLSSSEFDNMPQDQRTELAEKGVDLLLKMVFANNFVHADLHPGLATDITDSISLCFPF